MKRKKKKNERLPELKGVDKPVNFSFAQWTNVVGDNSVAVMVNGIEQGEAAHQRLGNRVCLKSLRLQMAIKCQISTENHGTPIQTARNYNHGTLARVVVVWDTRPGLTIPKFDDIFYELRTGGIEGIKVTHQLAPIGFYAQSRFRILRDNIIELKPGSNAPAGVGSDGGGIVFYKWIDNYINLEGYETTFNRLTTDDQSSMSTGAIYVYARCETYDDHIWTTADYGNARLRFTDPE